uniref:Uncharacterized protein n=1 Tax=Schistocephalus solidus TaxID=70667 RepID=A0A0X3P2Q9_SCHSO
MRPTKIFGDNIIDIAQASRANPLPPPSSLERGQNRVSGVSGAPSTTFRGHRGECIDRDIERTARKQRLKPLYPPAPPCRRYIVGTQNLTVSPNICLAKTFRYPIDSLSAYEPQNRTRSSELHPII